MIVNLPFLKKTVKDVASALLMDERLRSKYSSDDWGVFAMHDDADAGKSWVLGLPVSVLLLYRQFSSSD